MIFSVFCCFFPFHKRCACAVQFQLSNDLLHHSDFSRKSDIKSEYFCYECERFLIFFVSISMQTETYDYYLSIYISRSRLLFIFRWQHVHFALSVNSLSIFVPEWIRPINENRFRVAKSTLPSHIQKEYINCIYKIHQQSVALTFGVFFIIICIIILFLYILGDSSHIFFVRQVCEFQVFFSSFASWFDDQSLLILFWTKWTRN